MNSGADCARRRSGEPDLSRAPGPLTLASIGSVPTMELGDGCCPLLTQPDWLVHSRQEYSPDRDSMVPLFLSNQKAVSTTPSVETKWGYAYTSSWPADSVVQVHHEMAATPGAHGIA